MKTEAINKIIERLLAHEKRDVEYCNMYVVPEIREARAELAALIDGCAWEEAAKEKIAALEKRVADFEEGDEMHFRLVELQRSRMRGAEKAWQVAHNKPNTWPDLGDLIEWMGKQIAMKDEALSKAANLMDLLQYETVSNKKKLEVWDAVKAALTPDSGKVLVDRETVSAALAIVEQACSNGPHLVAFDKLPAHTASQEEKRILRNKLAALLKDRKEEQDA